MTEGKPGKSERTRAAILAAARPLFAARGYDRTSLRAIAAAAGVDPALVVRYFGGKDGLFAAAADPDLRLPDLTTVPRAEIGATLARHFLVIWEGGDLPGLPVLLRSAASNEAAAARLREVFAAQVAPALLPVAAGPDPATRAGLVASQILGLALCRYVLRLPPLVDLSPERLVAELAPILQRHLLGPEP